MMRIRAGSGTAVTLVMLVLLGVWPRMDAIARTPDATLAGAQGELARTRMQALDELVGEWLLTSVEYTAAGDALRAQGVRTCRWALNGTAIRCDDRFDLFGSINGMMAPVSVADSLFYLSFNHHTGLYEYTYYSPVMPELRTVPASFDSRLKVLTGSAWITDPLGEPRLAINESRLLGGDRIEETLKIAAPGDTRALELLEITLVRTDEQPAPVLQF